MNNYSIRPIPLVRSRAPKAMFTYLMNWGQQVTTCCGVWLIEGTERKVLVDTGRASLGSVIAAAEHEPIQTIEEGLGKFGLKTTDIELIILTHLHYDHVELAYKYPRAKFIVQKAELDFALKPRGVTAATYYKRDLFDRLNFEVIEGDREIIAPGIKVLLTPGHTPGGQSVCVSTRGGIAIITGFCCIRENFEPPDKIKEMMPIITPAVHTNTCELDESMIKLKEIGDIIIPLHDAEFFQKDRIPTR